MTDKALTITKRSTPSLPPIPAAEVDRAGMIVNTSGEVWRLNEATVDALISWPLFPCGGEIRHACMLEIIHSIRSHAPQSTLAIFSEICAMLRLVAPTSDDLLALDLDWWRNLRAAVRQFHWEYRMHRVRAWFLRMADLGIEGVDPDVAFEIERWRIPGNVKGEAVASRDKDSGPLTDLQFAALIAAVRREQPATYELAAVMLCTDLGSNPGNLGSVFKPDK